MGEREASVGSAGGRGEDAGIERRTDRLPWVLYSPRCKSPVPPGTLIMGPNSQGAPQIRTVPAVPGEELQVSQTKFLSWGAYNDPFTNNK